MEHSLPCKICTRSALDEISLFYHFAASWGKDIRLLKLHYKKSMLEKIQ
jgi:hypothetical protein